MNDTTAEVTAAQQYEEHQEAIIAMLDEIRGDIAMHSRHFDKNGRRSWQYPADLAHFRELLQRVQIFTNLL